MAVNFDRLNQACMNAFAAASIDAYTSVSAGDLADLPRGDFRNQATIVDAEDDMEVRTRIPMLGVRLAEFPEGVEPAQEDRVVIDGVSYRVVDVDDNGEGHAWLRLQEV